MQKDMIKPYDVFNNTLSKTEKMFITYENVINLTSLGFMQHVMEYQKRYEDKMNLELFKGKCNSAMAKVLLERKEKNVIDWLGKPEYLDELHKELDRYYDKTIVGGNPTDFGKGLIKLLMSNNISKIIISIDMEDKEGLQLIMDLFGDYNKDRIFIVDNKPETIKKYLSDKEYTLIATDELDMINECLPQLEGKSVCIPYMGYNFDVDDTTEFIDEEEKLLISKGQLEFKSIEYKFNLGFVEVYKMTEEMFMMG